MLTSIIEQKLAKHRRNAQDDLMNRSMLAELQAYEASGSIPSSTSSPLELKEECVNTVGEHYGFYEAVNYCTRDILADDSGPAALKARVLAIATLIYRSRLQTLDRSFDDLHALRLLGIGMEDITQIASNSRLDEGSTHYSLREAVAERRSQLGLGDDETFYTTLAALEQIRLIRCYLIQNEVKRIALREIGIRVR